MKGAFECIKIIERVFKWLVDSKIDQTREVLYITIRGNKSNIAHVIDRGMRILSSHASRHLDFSKGIRSVDG